jgi:hypothetical protein
MSARPWSSIARGSHDVRLVVANMDGTLLPGSGPVPESLWPMLDSMRARGIPFVPASGRQYATLARAFARAPSGCQQIGGCAGAVRWSHSALRVLFVCARRLRLCRRVPCQKSAVPSELQVRVSLEKTRGVQAELAHRAGLAS